MQIKELGLINSVLIWDHSKFLVTPKEQDHGVPGFKAKICSAAPVYITVLLFNPLVTASVNRIPSEITIF